ncbi:MAG TPA: hypothetical protein VHN11_17090 [Xanthobacteraceae bacterium]|jgi:hypothetical protein|nr:hypothetical protein [Xanthobacteraceae bacterium]
MSRNRWAARGFQPFIGAVGTICIGIAALSVAASHTFAGESICKPRHPLPAVILTSMGPCGFDPITFSFAGSPSEQARCLVRPVTALAKLGRTLENLPPALAHVGSDEGLPKRETLSTFLSIQGKEWDFGAHLWLPVSRTRDNAPDAPLARYFVIHDTSGPHLGRGQWPSDIDTSWKVNNLGRHRCSDHWENAHVVINRPGVIQIGHDFEVPWRATKFERATMFGNELKGLFLHTELVQPRRSSPRRGRRNDVEAPTPGFTPAQYESLALVYVIASVRAGNWLIPAFHAAIDNDIRNGHDDPQNFELDAFANSIDRLLDQLHQQEIQTIAGAAARQSTREQTTVSLDQ